MLYGTPKRSEENHVDVEGLRSLVKLKNKEIRHIRKQAQVRRRYWWW